MNNKMGMRVGEIIKALGMKKVRFAEQIGVDQSYMTKLSKGAGQPSDLLITSICREFNVSEKWLRTGEGDMFVKKEPQPLDKLLSELLNGQTVTDDDRTLMKNFLELPDASRKAVIEFVQKCAGELSAPVVDEKSETTTQAAPDLAAKVAALERQNAEKDKQLQELSARLTAMEKEEDLLWPSDTGNLA